MKYKIAVCDDEKEICLSVFNILEKIAAEVGHVFETDCFTSAEELFEEMRAVKYDLIFLDIEFPGTDGVAAGKFIRETLKNETVQLAYISSKTSYAMELFDMRPLNFLIKPLDCGKIKKVVDKFLSLSGINSRKFEFKSGSEFASLDLSEIIYFSSDKRKVNIATTGESFEFYGALKDVYDRIQDKLFLYVHKSFIVNYRYVKKYEYTRLTMSDGTVIPVSRANQKHIRERFIEIKEGK